MNSLAHLDNADWPTQYAAIKEEARSMVQAIEFMAGKTHPLARKARQRFSDLVHHRGFPHSARFDFMHINALMNKTTDTIPAPEF